MLSIVPFQYSSNAGFAGIGRDMAPAMNTKIAELPCRTWPVQAMDLNDGFGTLGDGFGDPRRRVRGPTTGSASDDEFGNPAVGPEL